MLIQGIRPGNSVLKGLLSFHKTRRVQFEEERLESAWQRMHRRDLSTVPQSLDAPSASVKMTKSDDE
jgi:hypothetical protein